MFPIRRGGSKRNRVTAGFTALLMLSTGMSTPVYAGGTATPIKHVIVIIGENRSFDHIFATYKPVHHGEYVMNLLRSSTRMAHPGQITVKPCNIKPTTSKNTN